jgi:hypothetical protein
LVGAVALGAALAFTWWAWNAGDSKGPEIASAISPAQVGGRFMPSERGAIYLAALRLPADCFSADEHAPTVEASTVHCCTECHRPGQKHASSSSDASPMLLAVVNSCHACHLTTP